MFFFFTFTVKYFLVLLSKVSGNVSNMHELFIFFSVQIIVLNETILFSSLYDSFNSIAATVVLIFTLVPLIICGRREKNRE